MSDYHLPLDAIRQARERIHPYVRHTPIAPLPPLADDFPPLVARVPPHVRLKLENLQVVGSFKPRGVFNTLLQLGAPARARGVMAASGGNHGVALAYAAHRLSIPATVYLPATASADRVRPRESLGRAGDPARRGVGRRPRAGGRARRRRRHDLRASV